MFFTSKENALISINLQQIVKKFISFLIEQNLRNT